MVRLIADNLLERWLRYREILRGWRK
jgi:hypothetical protein